MESSTSHYLQAGMAINYEPNICCTNNGQCSVSSLEDDLDAMDGAARIRNHMPLCLTGQLCSNHVPIKCDTTWKPNLKATAGWLFQDLHRQCFHVGKETFRAKTPLPAEAKALELACLNEISMDFRNIDATSDCLNLVLQLNGFGEKSDAVPIVKSLINLASDFHCFSSSHFPRNLNRVAHAIATSIA